MNVLAAVARIWKGRLKVAFQYDPKEHADLLQAMQQKIQRELKDKKGEFWARKVIYVSGMKAFYQSFKKENPTGTDTFMRLVAADIIKDLGERYPERDGDEVLTEFMADCDALINGIFDEAFGRGII